MPRELLLLAVAAMLTTAVADAEKGGFGPSNPFYAPSSLPFHAPPFDKIKDADYEPAILAGMAQQLAEVQAIERNPAAPTFENTFVPLEKSGRLLDRALQAFEGVSGANTDPYLQAVKTRLAPKLAAHSDAIFLSARLFARISRIHERLEASGLDPEQRRLVQVTYDQFVQAGARLSEEDKARLKKMNEEASTLSDTFVKKLLAANMAGAYAAPDPAPLAGLSDRQLAAAALAAQGRHAAGYVVPLQNTTQQPVLASLSLRATRQTIFENSWNRTERGDANDTRSIVSRLAQLRAQRAQLLGFASYAAWRLEDQMAKTPENALDFMNALVPLATARATREANDIQALIDAQHGGFTLEPWDWDFYGEQVRKAKYDLDDAEVKPYFELNGVLENGVFYAANQLYGISFKERKDIPVYQPDVRVFDVIDADGKPLALFYCDYFKRDNKNGGAWMSTFIGQSKLLGTRPVVYNVANLQKPAPGEPALLSFEDVTTLFHEFGHALHGMFADTVYPSLSGTATARDFVEFPSQFNEHWAMYPTVFEHYARHYKTGAVMPPTLVEKIRRARNFNAGYKMTEVLAAAELDMQWHTLPAGAPLQDPDAFQREALEKVHIALRAVPPRYRSSYFQHIWGGGYAAGYYAYLWTQMLADDAYQWFEENGGLTRANGDRFRQMILSRGNTEDLAAMYAAWRGRPPKVDAMLKDRGLVTP
ncbi:MAG TPA: peptidyl-dipeptidase Dcp [Steroidobacteraceae bacterium]|nr:peptidyl-dipeptidase Dcp [Steroidobacteraceae bacterium]